MGTTKDKMFPWTDEPVAELKRLHGGGLFSASEIGERLTLAFQHKCSRMAVIGKLRRLGLSNKRANGPQPRVRKITPERIAKFQLAKALRVGDRGWQASAKIIDFIEPAAEPVSDDAIPVAQRRTLLELENEHCRWPIGQGADMFFCGSPTADFPKVVYCRAHAAVAYQGFGRVQERHAFGARARG